jgi:hypothetical protein
MGRDTFAWQALANIPKILTLMDRNAHSPTYGCFDRAYWHYKIIDFPSGMAQEFVWPLALAYSTDIEGNVFHREPVIRTWVAAGISFAARSAHRDGSCDDYFPFERAAGAAAFSLLASIESYQLMELDDPPLLGFFERRADWLAGHRESGRLANHVALTALALTRLGELLGTGRWDGARNKLIDLLLSWQDDEGWFAEYDGFDPGYHTLTISCLARLHELLPDGAGLTEPIERAVRLAVDIVHPDGTFGGEYGSRNTYNFYPHGFELVGRWMPEALTVNDTVLQAVENGLEPCYADDHIIGHHTWNQLLAWRDWVSERPPPAERVPGRLQLPNAGIIVDRREGYELYAAPGKGGVFKLFKDGRLVVSDTQLSVTVARGSRTRNAVGHLAGEYEVEIGGDTIEVAGKLGWAKSRGMTPLRLVILRFVMLTVGRFFPDLIRRLLQSFLITGKNDAPFAFRRTLRWDDGAWTVSDELSAESWAGVRGAAIGGDQTSIYTVMSRVFQPHQLRGWLDLGSPELELSDGETLTVERRLE